MLATLPLGRALPCALLAFVVTVGPGGGGSRVGERVARIDREPAGKLLPLAATATQQGHGRLALEVCERVLELT